MNIFSGEQIVWMDLMRELANTGFIPYAKFMKPFIPQVKYDNWSAWKALLVKEGYDFEDGIYGWITTAKPIDSRKAELQKKIAELTAELDTL